MQSLAISAIRSIGNLVHAEIHWATIIYIIIFTLGGATFYSLLYKSKLIPRFLSVWGFLTIVLLFIGTVLAIFKAGLFSHMPLMEGMAWFAPPIALNELVLGTWLMQKDLTHPHEIPKPIRRKLKGSSLTLSEPGSGKHLFCQTFLRAMIFHFSERV